MNKPLVSVIIPTYKRCDMLPRAIETVLNQTYDNVQVVVVDDNDSDTEWRYRTSKMMESYTSDSRVLYVCHPRNLNGSIARNTGIKAASGEIITFLDDDDLYKPDKIEKQVRFLLEHPEYRAVYCGWHRDQADFMPKGMGDLAYGILSGSNIIITNVIMMWRKDALECGGWDPKLRRHQEAAFLLNFFRHGGQMGRVEEVLVEFDTTDRSNVSNPDLTEKQLDYLLKNYQDLIYKCESQKKGARKRIYSKRHLGIVLPYLKNKQYFKGIIKLLKFWIISPISFTKVLFEYIKWRTSEEHIIQTR